MLDHVFLYRILTIPYLNDRSLQKFLLSLQDGLIFHKSEATDNGLPEKELGSHAK